MMSSIELLKCCYQFGFLIPLAQQRFSEHSPTLHSLDNLIRLWHNGLTVIRKRRMRRDITAQEWKVNNGKIEVIPFVVKPRSKLSIVRVEIKIQA